MATFSYTDTTAQNDLIDEVEGWADKVTATGQSIGIQRESAYTYLQRAMRNIFQRVPREALDEASADGSGQTATNTGSHTEVELPEDFLIFLNLKLSEWQRRVYETIDPRSDQHRLQYNTHTQADPYNPVIAKVADPTAANGHALLCYPQDATPTLETFAYVPETAPENVPSTLTGPIVIQAAAYVLTSDKEQGIETLMAVADRLVGQIQRGQAPMIQQAFEEVRQQQQG